MAKPGRRIGMGRKPGTGSNFAAFTKSVPVPPPVFCQSYCSTFAPHYTGYSRRRATIRSKRLIGVLGLAAAVSARFWGAAVYSLRHPGYPGPSSARPATLACVGLVLLAALLSFRGGPALRRRAAIAFCGAAVLFIGSAAAASHTLFQIAGALLILLTAFGTGRAVLGWFGIEPDFSVLERGALATGLGLGLLSHLTLLLGLLHLLYPAIAFGALAALLGATRRSIWRGAKGISDGVRGILAAQAGEGPFTLAAVLIFVSIGAVQTLAPAIQYDDLHYHLWAPLQHVAAHRLVLLPDVIQSFFYQGVEMLYALAFLVGGETTAIFLNGSFGVLTALALAGFTNRVFGREAAWMSVLFWTTTPLVAWLVTTGYVDVDAAFYLFLCTIVAFGWMRRPDRRLALLAGALAGLALGVKLNAVLFVMALLIVLVTAALLARRFRDSVLFVVSFGAGAIPVGCVWPLLRYVQTGNPIYPFLNGVFRAPGIPFTNDWMNFGTYGMGTGLSALAALPWNISFHADRFIEALHPYVLGPFLLLAVVGCLAWPWLKTELRWAISIAALYTIAWFFRVQHLRYLAPVLPLVALIAAGSLCRTLESLRSAPRRAALIAVGALVACPSLVIWFASYYNIPERIPFRVIFGFESRDEYRARILPVYPAFRAVGDACLSSSRGVLTIMSEYGYLCPAMVVWTSPRASFVYKQASDDAYREMLRKLDIAYVVIDNSTQRPRTLPFVASGFLDRTGEILYQDRSATAIRLLAPGERPSGRLHPRMIAPALPARQFKGREPEPHPAPGTRHGRSRPTTQRDEPRFPAAQSPAGVLSSRGCFRTRPGPDTTRRRRRYRLYIPALETAPLAVAPY